ncbi:MAG: helix-turn-helix domain-containing protein [Intestinibacter sp.]
MSKFIDNVNKYIDHYKIKQTAISIKTGIEKNKLSRLLSGKQGILMEDMENISKALGKNVAYFLDDIKLSDIKYDDYTSIAFSMGKPTLEKTKFANTVFDFLEHIDAIIGIPNKLKKYSKEADYYEL